MVARVVATVVVRVVGAMVVGRVVAMVVARVVGAMVVGRVVAMVVARVVGAMVVGRVVAMVVARVVGAMVVGGGVVGMLTEVYVALNPCLVGPCASAALNTTVNLFVVELIGSGLVKWQNTPSELLCVLLPSNRISWSLSQAGI